MIRHRFGNSLNEYNVVRINTKVDGKGRVVEDKPQILGSILATLTVTSQKEREYYNQLGHPCTHTVATRNITNIKAGDILVWVNGSMTDKKRKFEVVDKRNPASLDIWEVIHVKELMSDDRDF